MCVFLCLWHGADVFLRAACQQTQACTHVFDSGDMRGKALSSHGELSPLSVCALTLIFS